MNALLASLLKPVLVLLAAWFSGKKAGIDAAKIQELDSYAETSKRMDKVDPMPEHQGAAEWLRRRAERDRNL